MPKFPLIFELFFILLPLRLSFIPKYFLYTFLNFLVLFLFFLFYLAENKFRRLLN